MNIGEASRLTSLSARAIRLYEASGIIGPPERGNGGYRRFSEDDIRALKFVQKARQLGFNLDSIRQLVKFWRMGLTSRAEIERLLADRIVEIQREEAAMRDIRQVLESTMDGSEQHGAGCKLLALLLSDDAVSNPAPASPNIKPPNSVRVRRMDRPSLA